MTIAQVIVGKDDNKLKNKDLTHLSFTVEEASEWTALFERTSGWFGADGIFSIPLNGGEDADTSKKNVLFIFSDTMIGEIVNGKLQGGSKMVHNSVAYMEENRADKNEIHFYPDKKNNSDVKTLFTPRTSDAQKGDYYWLGDGFVNHFLKGNTYIFAYHMRNASSKEWSFKQVGNALLVLKKGSKPPFKNYRQIKTPFLIEGEEETESSSLGAGIFANVQTADVPAPDGYIYVYGVKGEAKELIVARVLPENFENFNQYRFWDGEGWSAGITHATGITDSVSNELSVTPLKDGRYALVFQINGMSDTIGLRLGLSPYGPFGPIIKVWTCEESQRKNYFTYNAKAHPGLSNPGELIISYNVNAFDFLNEISANPKLYRPRFIKMKFE